MKEENADKQGAARSPFPVRETSFSGQHKIKVDNPYLQSIYRRLSIITVLVPFIGTILAVGLLSLRPIGFLEIALFVVMYTLTILGVEVGYHRLFAHKAFQTSAPVKAALAILGSMAAQGGCLFGLLITEGITNTQIYPTIPILLIYMAAIS